MPPSLAVASNLFYADFDGGPLCTLFFTDGKPGVADALTPDVPGVQVLSVTRSQTSKPSGQPESGPTGKKITVAGHVGYYWNDGLSVAYPDGRRS